MRPAVSLPLGHCTTQKRSWDGKAPFRPQVEAVYFARSVERGVQEWECSGDHPVTCTPFSCHPDAQVDGQVVALLVQNLERLDESVKEEADGVHNTLGKGESGQHFLSFCLFWRLAFISFFLCNRVNSQRVFLFSAPKLPVQK